MILKNIKKVIYLNAGHWDKDPGASGKRHGMFISESDVVKSIRDRLVPMLRNHGFEVHVVPDSEDLVKSIQWVNSKAMNLNDGLAIDIHMNSAIDPRNRGTEAYYGTSVTTKTIAETISRYISKGLGIPDRGAKPDTESNVKRLAWIRDTKCWSTLIEVGFITNDLDMTAIEQNPDGASSAICNAILELYGVAPMVNPLQEIRDDVQKLLTKIDNLLK